MTDWDEDDYYIIEKSSMWLIDVDLIRPSTTLNIQKKLNPGVYVVDHERTIGVFCKKVEVNTDELYELEPTIVTGLFEQISNFWDKKELYKENNLLHKRGILLEGPPGNGKTSIISQLSKQIIDRNGLVFLVSNNTNLNTFVEFIVNNFRSIEPDTPIITVLEDIDKYSNSEVILDFLDGKTNIEHQIIICTSNNTENIPDTFLRPSRIDLRIEITYPSESVRRKYFTKKGVIDELLDVLTKESEGLSMADLKELYISIFLLDIPLEEAVERIKKPKEKINYIDKKPVRHIGV